MDTNDINSSGEEPLPGAPKNIQYALDSLKRELQCRICLSTLQDAYSLPCNHHFCKGCIIQSLIKKSECPLCRLPCYRRDIRRDPHINEVVSSFHEMKKALQTHFNSISEETQPFTLPYKRRNSDNENSKNELFESSSSKKRKTNHQLHSLQTDPDNGIPSFLQTMSVAELQYQLHLYQKYIQEIETLLSQTETFGTSSKSSNSPTPPQPSDSFRSNSSEWFLSAKRRQENIQILPQEQKNVSSLLHRNTSIDEGNKMKHDKRDLTTEHFSNALPDTEGTADSSDVSALFNNIMAIESEKSTQCENNNKVSSMNKQNSMSDDKKILETQNSSNSLSQLKTKENTNSDLTTEKKNLKKVEKIRNSHNSNSNNKTQLKSSTSPNHGSNQNLKTSHISSNSKNLKIVLLGTNLSPNSFETLKAAVRSLGGTYLQHYNSSVTHIITDYNTLIKQQQQQQSSLSTTTTTNHNNQEGKQIVLKTARRTLKYLFGILEGKWILTSEWIKQSLAEGQWLQEEPFEVDGDVHGNVGGPRKGRIAASQQSAPLFNSIKFLLHGEFTSPTRTELKKLIVYGGGEIVKRVTDLKVVSKVTDISTLNEVTSFVVICDANLSKARVQQISQETGIEPVKTNWILDSISCFEILPLQNYRFCLSNQDNNSLIP